MAVTRTTGGAGNDEDEGNGDVCVFVCLRVCVRVRVRVCVRVLVRRHVLRGRRASMAAWHRCTHGSDVDDRR